MFPFFMKKLMKNFADFHVPGAGLVLEIEDLVSIEKNSSIAPLLRLLSGSLSMLDLAEAFLGRLGTDLLLRQFVHSDFQPSPSKRSLTSRKIVLLENESDMAILERYIQQISSLLALAHKEMENPLSSQLDHEEYPPLVKKISHLRGAILKDKIKKVQRDYFRLSRLKE
ncbi:hypothetical protein AMTRI_Chr05g63120 [Amborella trichopoda]